MASLLSACGGNHEDETALYPIDSMVNILMDIHLAEARIENTGYRNIDTARADYKKLEQKIFEKHHIDTAKYRKSFDHYTDNIELMSEIYTIIRDSFKLKDSVMKAEYIEVSPPDETHSGMNKKNQTKPKIKRKKKTDSTLKFKN